ncbi:hypothetical protein CDAR_613891 [Caerostris darwini]|uniref:Uncharacterized protein n=1 Tax=Caerostris darwini TaxID=1538125 RepID=A0AAV4MIE7_9ARAC|nr:hypothetical protein CDAR_613891 [Caerostris darwini]
MVFEGYPVSRTGKRRLIRMEPKERRPESAHIAQHRNPYSSTDIPLKLTPRTRQPESNPTAATITKSADPFGVELSAIRRKAATRFRRAFPLFNSMQMKTGERPGWDFLRVVSSGHLFQKYGRMDHTEADRCDEQVQEESGST